MNHPASDPQLDALRTPPHSVEAEQSVLGGLLLDNSAWDKIGDLIAESDFYRYDHRLIFQHIARLVAAGRPADVVTVFESLQNAAKAEEAGGLSYLNAVAQNTPSAANIRRYAEIVRDRAVLRKLVTVADDIATTALNPQGKETKQILDEAESKVFQIAEAGARGGQGFQELPKLLTQVVERIDELYHRDNQSDVTGVPTGFADLDRMTSGLQEGDLVIVAGRPSMGKAQPLDARVRTPAGWKRMGDLRVGDALVSIDGQASAVTGIFPQGTKQIFNVCFSDGRQTRCCGEHLWRVHYRDWEEARVLSTEKVAAMLQRKRYQSRLWIDMVNGESVADQPLPIDPWVLGALLGDGDLSGSSLRFSTAAEEMLQRMRARVGAEMTLEYAQGYDWRIVRAPSDMATGYKRPAVNPLKHHLSALGLWDKSSHEKFIPESYLNASRSQRLDVLRGLLDTDGWVEKWGSVRFCTTSQALAEGVVALVRSLGGWCSIKTKQTRYTYLGKKQQGRTAYVCNIHHPEPRSLFLLSDKVARLPERYVRGKKPTFAAIEPAGLEPAQCISVSHPSRLYVTDDYVVTHNTAFSLNIGEHVAIDQGLPVAVFSMEMGGTQLATRMLGSVGRLDQQRVRTGRLQDEDWPRLTHAIQKMQDAQLYIDETPALNSMELRARARRLSRQCGKLGLIIVDYLQLMSANSSSGGENRATEISEISRSLKALAKELHCPGVALSQLNRSLEQRPNKRPVMSDLREAGAIEQDADVIIFIYRDEVYNPDSQDKGTAEIIIGKQRNGPIGAVRLTFLGEYTKFENFTGGGGYSGGSDY